MYFLPFYCMFTALAAGVGCHCALIGVGLLGLFVVSVPDCCYLIYVRYLRTFCTRDDYLWCRNSRSGCTTEFLFIVQKRTQRLYSRVIIFAVETSRSGCTRVRYFYSRNSRTICTQSYYFCSRNFTQWVYQSLLFLQQKPTYHLYSRVIIFPGK